MLGAGLAGLAAAVTLARDGLDVQVLEARERVGGRVYTLRGPFDDGLHAEAGAEFISPGHAVLRRFLRAYGVQLGRRPDLPRTYFFEGRLVRGWSPADYGGRIRADFARAEERPAELIALIPDPRRVWEAPSAVELDAVSLGAWFDQQPRHPVVRAFQRLWVTVDYGVTPDKLSLLMYARDEKLIAETPPRSGDLVPGGLDALPRAMAAELGPRVHLATRATGIEQDHRGATVHYERPEGNGALEAEYVVVALPATALRRLEIAPPLDPPRREAIAGLRYNQVLKVHLQFKRRFWHDGGGTVGLMSDLPIQTAWDSTYAQPGERGILSVYAADWAALELAALPEPRRWEFCVEQLERIYPGCGAAFETGASVVWHEDPASGGAYSYFAPGELTRFAPWLARPAGRLHFAGEHTDTWQSTMNGALASGVRAAEEVVQRSTFNVQRRRSSGPLSR